MENVQRVIGELATIFQRVATMISHQDEMIQRIDHDIDTSMHNIREGTALVDRVRILSLHIRFFFHTRPRFMEHGGFFFSCWTVQL